jgi:hypothetical protein
MEQVRQPMSALQTASNMSSAMRANPWARLTMGRVIRPISASALMAAMRGDEIGRA